MKLDVNDYVNKEKEILKNKFEALERESKLWVLTDSSSEASESYMRSKVKIGKELGVKVKLKVVNNAKDVIFFCDLARARNIPVILQLPCCKECVSTFNSIKNTDVDGFFSYEGVYKGDFEGIVPATPKGILKYIKYYHRDREGYIGDKRVLIIGRGNLVGKPLASLILPHIGTLTIATSKTKNLVEKIIQNDIIIFCTGKEDLLTEEDAFELGCINLKKKLVIDSGIFREEGKLHGEFTKFYLMLDEGTREKFDYTPVPKGVGILTTLNLFDNVYNFCLTQEI